MIKLINILKEIKVFKPFKPLSIMYNDVKPIIANYVNDYDMGIQNNFLGELSNGDLQNNLAYDLAEYDGFTGSFIDLIDMDANHYYNSLAYAFLVKYGFETKILKFPFPDGYEEDEDWLRSEYNNGDPDLDSLEGNRGQF